VLAIPGFVGSALDPVIGLLGDTRRRRAMVVLGGVGFALSTMLSSVAVGFVTLLVALVIGNPANGAFVSLSQATLMDLDPTWRERNMARWTLAGSLGYVAGPVILAAGLSAGLGWRPAVFALGFCALPLAALARRLPRGGVDGRSLRGGFADAAAALRRADVLRWSRCSKRATSWWMSSTASWRFTSSMSRASTPARRHSLWLSGQGPAS
jgi:FSR family fosmidomycin resistance protein-like MFS transporter